MATVIAIALSVFGYRYWTNLPRVPKSYYGVVLNGDRKPDVLYKLGFPSMVPSGNWNPSPRNVAPYWVQLSDLDTVQKYDEWVWHWRAKKYRDVYVGFDKSSGTVATVECSAGTRVLCPPLVGIMIGDSEDKVRSQLGSPSSESIDRKWFTKTLVYGTLNVQFHLNLGKVYEMRLGPPGPGSDW